jgi:hypothetical protein
MADNVFLDGKLIRSQNAVRFFISYVKCGNLNALLSHSLAPWRIIGKFTDALYRRTLDRVLDSEPMPQTIIDKAVIYGDKYDGGDTWFIDALAEISARTSPQFTVLHDLKAHVPFYRNKNCSRAPVSENEAYNPDNYPPQHRYTAKIVLAYIAVILEHDPDAVIVIEADHGHHDQKTREQLLAKKRTPRLQ